MAESEIPRASRSDMLPSGTAASWRGLIVDLRSARIPGLRIEAAPPRHLRIVQASETVLWAVLAPDYCDVAWFRSDSWQAVIPPPTASEARRRQDLDCVEWWQSWIHWFAEQLEKSSNGPLCSGTWTLRPAALDTASLQTSPLTERVALDAVGYDPELFASTPAGELDWLTGAEGLLPLHTLPPPSDGRVKAYRKQLQSGSMAPLLAWWASSLACHVVIDGHSRLAAALAEDASPPIVTLTAIRKPADVSPHTTGQAFYEQRREGIYAHGGAGTKHAEAIEKLIAEAQLRSEEHSITPGFPLKGGIEAWRADVAARAKQWRVEG